MSERRLLNLPSCGILVGLAVSLGACDVAIDSGTAIYTAREEKRFAVTGRPDVTLSTFDGSIDIKAWDRPEVVVEVEKRAGDKALADAILIKADQSANKILVEVPKPTSAESGTGFHVGGGSAFFGRMGSSARLTVSVPRDCDVVARTGDGSIAIERVTGRLDLETGDGSVKGRDLGGTLKVHTEDGILNFRDVKGKADLDTGDGGITIAGVLEAVRAQTGDGVGPSRGAREHRGRGVGHPHGRRQRVDRRAGIARRRSRCEDLGWQRPRRRPVGERIGRGRPPEPEGQDRRRRSDGANPDRERHDHGQEVLTRGDGRWPVGTPASSNASRRSRHLLHNPHAGRRPASCTTS
jgi:hypothetical protein